MAVSVDQALLDEFLSQLEADPDVDWVEPDIFIGLPGQQGTISNAAQRLPWGIERIGGAESSTVSGDGKGRVKGVDLILLDSGEPDVNINLSAGTNLTDTRWIADEYGHASHVAGTVGECDNDDGTVGVAPCLPVWAMKVLDDAGESEISTVVEALDLAIERKLAKPGTTDGHQHELRGRHRYDRVQRP